MQIQYCDGCNLRVDNKEIVTQGDKVYCPACAEKFARPGSSAQQMARPSSGIRRTSPAPGTPRRSPTTGSPQLPASGIRNTRAGATQIRSAGGTTVTRAAHTQPPADSKSLVWGLAGAGVLLAVVGVFLMAKGKPSKTPDSSKTVAQVKKDDPPVTQTKTDGAQPKNQPNIATGTNSQPELPAQPKSGLIGGGMEDYRESLAQRELDRIKQEKLPASEAYRRYMKFLERYRSTKAGKEAETLAKTVESSASRPADNPSRTIPGLKANRYEVRKDKYVLERESIDWSKPLDSQTIANVEFRDAGSLGNTFKAQEFLVLQITGFIEAPRDGSYTFSITSDDGSLLYLGNHLLINNDGDHAMTDRSEAIPLKAGKHAFKLLYYNGKGEAGLVLSWSGPDIPRQTIPASALSQSN
jgi:hypothetical protein